jgi:hypothetical protein
MGRVHFGVLLGWSVAQSVVVYFVANQVASNDGSGQRGLDLYSCCCVTGYGMVPLILVNLALLLVPRCARGGSPPSLAEGGGASKRGGWVLA